MKKILLLLTALLPLAVVAQPADGYYRILNNASERYATISNDIVGEVNKSDTQADLSNIVTYRGFDKVKSNPASILYIRNVNGQYDLAAQGTSIYKIAGGRTYVDLLQRTDDIYLISVTHGGFHGNLQDSPDSRERGSVSHASRTDPYQYWRIIPIDTENNYIGLQPVAEAADGWYGTIYAEFPFKLVSEGITVYYVDGVKQGQFQLKEITDEIKPGATPLVFKCSSNDPANNKIQPVFTNTTTPTDNMLLGTYFACETNGHEQYVEYNKNTMRVLGVDADKNLVLTTASTSYLANEWLIPANTCYLKVPEGLSGDFKRVDRDTYTGISNIEASLPKPAQKGTYTLTGVRVDNSKTLRPGVYIRDGKKVIIK